MTKLPIGLYGGRCTLASLAPPLACHAASPPGTLAGTLAVTLMLGWLCWQETKKKLSPPLGSHLSRAWWPSVLQVSQFVYSANTLLSDHELTSDLRKFCEQLAAELIKLRKELDWYISLLPIFSCISMVSSLPVPYCMHVHLSLSLV